MSQEWFLRFEAIEMERIVLCNMGKRHEIQISVFVYEVSLERGHDNLIYVFSMATGTREPQY